jgi:anaerobic selenocysteine-containing dehydrogenase
MFLGSARSDRDAVAATRSAGSGTPRVLQRHFARYTAEMVEQVSGVPEDQFGRVCRLITEDIGTGVFFLPAAAHTEKSGSFTNTQRMLQWHHQAVEPAGDARSDLSFSYDLGRRIRAKLAASTSELDRPVLDLTWDYPTKGPLGDPDADAVLAEINGSGPDGQPLSAYSRLAAVGRSQRQAVERA